MSKSLIALHGDSHAESPFLMFYKKWSRRKYNWYYTAAEMLFWGKYHRIVSKSVVIWLNDNLYINNGYNEVSICKYNLYKSAGWRNS